MDAKARYDEVKKKSKVVIECPDCNRSFSPEKWDARTREGFNAPGDPIDIIPILQAFNEPPQMWNWYTCPGCSNEINSNKIRVHNYNEDIDLEE